MVEEYKDLKKKLKGKLIEMETQLADFDKDQSVGSCGV
jgi:hypothetical protein